MPRIISFVLTFAILGVTACGGRTAPSLWWTLSNQNNGNSNNNNTPENCGNGIVEPYEPCDGPNLGGQDCYTLGYDGGTLICSQMCRLDPSGCWICGDGICGDGEQWECPWDCEGWCGDGVCQMGEEQWCPEDCEGWCGDGVCQEGEEQWCPEDCEGWCGDGVCQMGEEQWCPEDCEGWCGDGVCQMGEEQWCPEDCEGWCGDGVCQMGEEQWCPEDCQGWCGNGICDPGEQALSCPEDCQGWCGDRICDLGEASWCPQDCQTCGNGICDEGEWQWCPQDCPGLCGNGICEPVESPATCPEDCGTCGDGICAPGEETWCPQDCGTTTTTLSCQAISLCILCCSANDAACRTACRQAGSAASRAEFSDYRTCAQNQCPGVCTSGVLTYDCFVCARINCAGICGFGAVGQAGCNELLTCTGGCAAVGTGGNSQTCPSDSGVLCRNTCWAEGDAQAETLYEALMGCVALNCGTICGGGGSSSACQSCIYQQCGAQAGSCIGD